MSSAAEKLTDDERDALLRALVKLVGPEKLARLALPGRAVVPVEPDPDRKAKLEEKVRRNLKRQGAL